MRYKTNRRHTTGFQVDYTQSGETRPTHKQWQLTALAGWAMEAHAGAWETGGHFFPASDSLPWWQFLLGHSATSVGSLCSGNTMSVSCSFCSRGGNNFLLLPVPGHLTFLFCSLNPVPSSLSSPYLKSFLSVLLGVESVSCQDPDWCNET